MKKRLLSWVLTLSMVISMIPASIISAGAAYTIGSYAAEYDVANLDNAVFENSRTYRLYGTGDQPVVIPENVKVTIVLDNVTINSVTSPIQVGTNAVLQLVPKSNSDNTLVCTSTTEELVATNTASGLTAGISVPTGAELSITNDSAGDGTLTVTGGYGGAGIGGSYTGALLSEKASMGSTGSTGETGYSSPAGPGGVGGEGGLYGDKGTDAGTIEISGGIVNITGGTDGVGIGGGKGTNGKKGNPGKPGTQGTIGYDDGNWHFFGSGGSGGGGAGGNGGTGGTGGDSGDVTIRGGSVTIRGTGNAVAIGGGSGGTGGAGGDGGDGGAAIHHEQAQEKWVAGLFIAPGGGGKGGDGENGYGGRGGEGGAAGTLTISGGMVSAIGTKGYGGGCVGQDGKQDLESQDTAGQRGKNPNIYVTRGGYYGTQVSYDYTVYHQTISSGDFCVANQHKGGNGGTRAAQDTNINSDGPDGTLTISGSNNNVDFKNRQGETSANNRAVDQNGTPVYKTIITVKNLEGTENLSSAKISIPVTSENGTSYNYETVTDSMGEGIVWLPEGTYTLSGKMVQSAGAGWMTEDKTLNVERNDSNKLTVNVGVAIELKTSSSGKVYFKDNAMAENIVVDGSKIDGSIGRIRWFREAVNDNDQAYGTGSLAVEKFEVGYNKAVTANKGEIPVLKKCNMIVTYDSCNYDETYNLINIADFNSLIAQSQSNNTPVFLLTQEQVQKSGSV